MISRNARLDELLELNIVRKRIVDDFGEDAIQLIRYMRGRSEVSDANIVQDTGIPEKSVQKSLLKMQDRNVMDCKKLVDDKGYITYLWSLDENGLLEYLEKNVFGVFDELIIQLEEGVELYYCSSCSKESPLYFSYEDSLAYKFKCPNCGSKLEPLTPEIVHKLKEEYMK
ncbi:MAG: hypothetical protein QW336_00550 [Candidatus Anstonellales archaeon]